MIKYKQNNALLTTTTFIYFVFILCISVVIECTDVEKQLSDEKIVMTNVHRRTYNRKRGLSVTLCEYLLWVTSDNTILFSSLSFAMNTEPSGIYGGNRSRQIYNSEFNRVQMGNFWNFFSFIMIQNRNNYCITTQNHMKPNEISSNTVCFLHSMKIIELNVLRAEI